MRRSEDLIEILLATYNGANYLCEQIESIFNQTYSNWKILVHDDGSTDKTLETVRTYTSKYPNRIMLMEDGITTWGAKNNFAHLMSLSTAEYVAFCDQDDIWLPRKLELSIEACKNAEKHFGEKVPIGVFSDARVVDADLNSISASLWHMQGTDPSLSGSIKRLSVRNCVTGCTLLINNVALQKSLPIPSVAPMHDWWISLVILKNGGVLIPIEQATVLYRQHFGNSIGAKNSGWRAALTKALSPATTLKQLWEAYQMAKHLGSYRSLASFCAQKIRELIASGDIKTCERIR